MVSLCFFVHLRRLKTAKDDLYGYVFFLTDVSTLDKLLLKAVTELYKSMLVNANKKVNPRFRNAQCEM